MNRRTSSLDGFVPRTSGSRLGEHHVVNGVATAKAVPPARKQLQTEEDMEGNLLGSPRSDRIIGRSDIDESLKNIEDPEHGTHHRKMSRREKRRWKKENRTKAQRIRRRIIWIVTLVILALIMSIGGYLVYKTLNAGGKVLQGSFFDIVQNQPLKEDKNGRSNFLIFGTESEGHPGADLTDSIMVMSVSQSKKDAYMISLPRDLWVQYENICTVGNQGKLNAAYYCASNDGEDERAGAEALMRKAGEITGLDIQYYVHLNWAALIQSVDAVGGIDVTIQSSDPRGILDRNFDATCNYTCYYVNYKNGETAHLDGEHALALARARNASGGYGLPNGNFDREKNQQLIIKALREKAASAGTLTNLSAVTGLIDALGNNLRTNIETKEVRTLMDLGTTVATDKITSLSLNEEGNMLVTTGNYNGQSIVRPTAGLMDYSGIAAHINREILSEPFMKEEPNVMVLNGSGEVGIAQLAADKLEEKGFTIATIDNAPEGTYQRVEIYQVNADKTASATKLKELYGATPKKTTPPVSVTGDVDFVVIIGNADAVR